MSPQRVLVVSIDGVAPRFVTPAVMPYLCGLAAEGASTFDARTVVPSITLPAHTSLLRGISPQVHGILDNTPLPLRDEWGSFLAVARRAGLSTAALLNWSQVDGIVESDAVDQRYFLNGGYGPDDDRQIAAAATVVLASEPHVAFAYLVSPDLAGHDHGWGSAPYLDSLARSDAALGSLLAAVGPKCAVIVTTDHGGHDRDHQQSHPLDMRTFVVLRAQGVSARSWLPAASILDVAPTVAALAGFTAPLVWEGVSLLGTERPLVDHVLSLVDSMASHSYGERVNMLEHSLQSAAVAQRRGATDPMVVAALLHDLGHLLGDAGEWGLADHAQRGADFLQPYFPASVVEPIRRHVDAKRYLVARNSGYHDALSYASQQSLLEQGGPFTASEAEDFAAQPWSDDAVALRRYDDEGKAPDQHIVSASSYRDLLERVLASNQAATPTWLRDACTCHACRDTRSGQHLLGPGDLHGWHHHGENTIRHDDGREHTVSLGDPASGTLRRSLWTEVDRSSIQAPASQGQTGLADFAGALSEFGIAFAAQVPPRPGSVLEFAKELGFVRNTNYGELFDVKASPAANNLAYTTLGLPLHTDNPYRDPVPTVQLLHCLVAAPTGGASQFCDAFAVAEHLRANDPDAFEVLSRTPQDFRFADATVDLRARRPIISLNLDGEVDAVFLNHRSMVTPPPSPGVEAFYAAYASFNALASSAAFVIECRLEEGDLVGFNNRRVLHARTGYSTAHARHLQGCYIDIDAVDSMARSAGGREPAVS